MANYVGQRIKRTEDPRLIKGLAHYVDDVRLPDTLHVAFVRSIYAHARLGGVDVTEAVKAPGVVAVYTGKDIATKVGPVPCAGALPDLKVPDYRVLARYFPGEEELTLWSSTQIPHLLRTQLALMIGIPENKLRVMTPEVGGGFGSKLNVYAEEALLGWISIQLGKPVKWIESRRENVQATIHGRAQVGTIEVGVKNDGTITGLRYNVVADLGAYHQLLTPAIPTLTGLMLSGAYKIPAIQMNVTGVFTNKMSTDAYRGAGRPEATYVVERIMDVIARELNLDPVAVRRKNFPNADEFPFHTATGLDYDSGDYEAALAKALDLSGYQKLRADQAQARADGKLMGIGMSSYVEICALGPSQAMPAGGWESATVRIEPTGKVTVMTGASPHGQGQETSFAQIAADELGVDLNDVTVIHGDTAIVQYGIGTFGSRATAVGGTAVLIAIQKLKEKAAKIAAHMMQADAARLTFESGRYSLQPANAAASGVSGPG